VAELTPLQQRYSDRLIESQSALWSSLLTAEALFLGLAPILSAAADRQDRILWTVFLAAGLTSAALLVWNFVATRNIFLRIGQILHEVRRPEHDDVADAGRLHRRNRTRERVTLFLMAVQLTIILIRSIASVYE
jgi:hypothetical protein